MPFYTVDKEFIYRKLLSEVYIRTYYEYKEKYFQESLWYNLNTTERTTFWRMCNAYILLHYLKKTNMIKKAQLHSVYAIFFLLTMPIYRPSWIHVCKVYPLHQCIFMTFWIMTSTICFFSGIESNNDEKCPDFICCYFMRKYVCSHRPQNVACGFDGIK